MAADKVEFELVSPERLLTSEQVDMVVVPGAEGDFGVLSRHAPLISALRPGVIRIFDGREVRERIFVAGGFAEVTPERCTVLAEEAVPVREIDAGKIDDELRALAEDLGDAKNEDERAAISRRIAVRQAMRAAIGQAA
jgi:F-type H+-transporting ATPase subunit epsilon